MILITGGTGFIGRALVRHLVATGQPVRTLIRPSPRTPRLPIGVPVEVAVVSLTDTRGLRAALSGVDVVYHLASAETQGVRGDLLITDIQGTQNLATAAADVGLKRLVYVSHLGADRASAFPVLKAKAIAEEHIRKSGVPYTIVRSAIVYGPEDHFTTRLARLIRLSPGLLALPGDGGARLQPVWVEDLVTCLRWAIENPETINKTFEIGGSEYFPLRQVIELIMERTHRRRLLFPLPMPLMRVLVVMLETFLPRLGVTSFWLDYLSINRTCEVEGMTRAFGLMPARITYRIEYLSSLPWYTALWQGLQERFSRR